MGEIYRASRACQSNLEKCSRAWKPDPWAGYQLIEFNIWSTTAGALASGINSLDERFQLSKQHAGIIQNLLWLLNRYIDDCGTTDSAQDALSGSQPIKWAPEATEARESVETTLSQIIAITTHANASIVHSNLWIRSEGAFLTNDNDLEYENSLIEWFFDPQNLDFQSEARRRSGLTLIQKCLIQANLKRRRRFLAAKASSNSSASQLQQRRSLRSKIQYPSPPTLKADQKIFTCPHCYQDLPAYFAQSSAWL